MRKEGRQGGLEGESSKGDTEKYPALRSEQELKSTLNAMAREDRKELIAALKDWLHE
jgi:hypothetical protein